MSLRNKLRCVGLTDTGKVREHNEDTIAVDADIGLLVLAVCAVMFVLMEDMSVFSRDL